MFEKKMFGLAKAGTYKVWNIKVIPDHPERLDRSGAIIRITHGQEGGSLTVKEEYVGVGKQGRTAVEQAVMQAGARVKKNHDKNYRETKEELADIPIIAMLAKDHNKDGSVETIEKGVYASDKLDGVRCLAKCIAFAPSINGKAVTLESRTGQPYTVPHVQDELLKIMNIGDILDGELYVHGECLQDITSAVKRVDAGEKMNKLYLKAAKLLGVHGKEAQYEEAHQKFKDAEHIADIRAKLEFRVFDIVIMETSFVERLAELNGYAIRFEGLQFITKVDYFYCDSMEDMLKLHKDAVDRGYEGLMYRTANGEYESGKRSAGLWKYKTFFDAEFQVVRIHKDKDGNAIFELRNDINRLCFDCVMGSYEWRKSVIENPAPYLGKWMIVKFQARNKGTLIPQFGTGKGFREGTVINGEFVPSE